MGIQGSLKAWEMRLYQRNILSVVLGRQAETNFGWPEVPRFNEPGTSVSNMALLGPKQA